MEDNQRSYEMFDAFVGWVENNHAVPLQDESLSYIIHARLSTEGDENARRLHKVCLGEYRRRTERRRVGAWESYDAETPSKYAGDANFLQLLKPVLRAEYNARVFEHKYGVSMPKSGFDFSLEDCPEDFSELPDDDISEKLPLKEEMRNLIIFLEIEGDWKVQTDFGYWGHFITAVQNHGKKCLYLWTWALCDKGDHLLTEDGEILRTKDIPVDNLVDGMILRRNLRRVEEILVNTQKRLRASIQLRRYQAGRVIEIVAAARLFERMRGESLSIADRIIIKPGFMDGTSPNGVEEDLLADAVIACKEGRFRFAREYLLTYKVVFEASSSRREAYVSFAILMPWRFGPREPSTRHPFVAFGKL